MQYSYEMAMADVKKASTVEQVRDIGCKVTELYDAYMLDLNDFQWRTLLTAFRNRSNEIEAVGEFASFVKLCA